jgi:anti-sigma regulatory factor (Ser/Thr protein kinase)
MRTVTVEEIAQRAAASAGQPPDAGVLLFFSAINVMREELRQGNRIEIPNLVSLQVGDSGAFEAEMTIPAAAAQPAAQPSVVPAAPPAPAAVRPAVVPPAAQPSSKILLVVPMQDMFTNIMANRLAGVGATVTVAEGSARATQVLDENRPDLVVIDANIPDSEEMIREVKLNRDRGLISAISVYPEGVDPNRVQGLHVCEDETVQEPFDVGDLVSMAESELGRVAEERNFFEEEIHFQFQTTEEHIERANELVAQLIDQASFDEEKAASLSVAYREAVDNAARHGNKNQENKVIDTIYLLDKQKVTITVEDEGEGFDTELYLTRGIEGNAVAVARERNQAGRVGGLGIMLMLKCLDDLEYNYVGNLVKLTKYR